MLEANVHHLHINLHMQEMTTVVVETVAAGIDVFLRHLPLIAWKMSQIVNGSIHRNLAITKGLS